MPIRTTVDVKDKSESPIAESTAYSEDYKQNAFLHWYQAGKPRGNAILDALPVDEYGRKPNIVVFNKWRRELKWDEKASELDVNVRDELERAAVEEKVKMFRHHAQIAQQLQELGISWLEEHGIDSANSAVRAIMEGVKIERQSVGIPEFIERLHQMTESQLLKEYEKLTAGMEDEEGEVVDGSFVADDFEEVDVT